MDDKKRKKHINSSLIAATEKEVYLLASEIIYVVNDMLGSFQENLRQGDYSLLSLSLNDVFALFISQITVVIFSNRFNNKQMISNDEQITNLAHCLAEANALSIKLFKEIKIYDEAKKGRLH